MSFTSVLLVALVGFSHANELASTQATSSSISTSVSHTSASVMHSSSDSASSDTALIDKAIMELAVLQAPVSSVIATSSNPALTASGLFTTECPKPATVTVTILRTSVISSSTTSDAATTAENAALLRRHSGSSSAHPSRSASASGSFAGGPAGAGAGGNEGGPENGSTLVANPGSGTKPSSHARSATATGKAASCPRLSKAEISALANADQGSDGEPPCNQAQRLVRRTETECASVRGASTSTCKLVVRTATSSSCVPMSIWTSGFTNAGPTPSALASGGAGASPSHRSAHGSANGD